MPATPDVLSNSVPILLVPPSEGKATGGFDRPWEPSKGSFGRLWEHREVAMDALAAAHGGDQKLLGLKGERLADAQDANMMLVGAPTLPAWRRYTGVVWDHMGPATLTPDERRRLIVPSGLLGLVRGDDPVPPYRLKMGARLPPLGLLSTWWRPIVTETLARRLRGEVVIDLLPQEHRAAWAPRGDVVGVRIEFVDRSGKPGGHFAKAAKGRLARAILRDGPVAIENWRDDRFDLAVIPLPDR